MSKRPLRLSYRLLYRSFMTTAVFFTLAFTGAAARAAGEDSAAKAEKPAPDVITFTNGDQLTGKFVRAIGDTITFHSDVAGDVSVKWDKVKDLRSSQQFAVLLKGQHVNHKTPSSAVPQGTIQVADQQILVRGTTLEQKPIPAKNTEYVIDTATFEKEVHREPGFFYGWNGSVAAGAAFVEATQSSQAFNVGIALARLIPTVDWLTPRNRTTANFTDIYGKTHQSGIPDTKTSIFHADAERDWYFTPRFYALADTSFDHNFSQGLDLQQIYGGGFGYTVIKQPNQQLDTRADIHYERQSFSANPTIVPLVPAPPSTNLVGSSFGETYLRKLPRGLVFNEAGVLNVSYNNTSAYSSNVSAGLVFPVYKRLGFNIGAVDSYLNNPPAGFKNNSFQFTTGVTYTLR